MRAGRPAPIHPDLAIYLPRVAAPALAAICLATAGLGMALTPPGVPASWRTAGLVLMALAAIWLGGLVWYRGRVRARLIRATRVLGEGTPHAMRLVLCPARRGRSVADLVPVKRGDPDVLAPWPASPVGAIAHPHPEKPAHRLPVLAPPRGLSPDVGQPIQAEVFLQPDNPHIVVIRTRRGCLVSTS